MTHPAPTLWRNRIIDHGEEDPGQLLAHPANFRVHPQRQQDALGEVLDRVGWVQDVIVNRRTGHVVDGHLRVSLALRREEALVPVSYVDLSPEEERLILATFDGITGLAVLDSAKVAELLADLGTQGPRLDDLLAQLRTEAKPLDLPAAPILGSDLLPEPAPDAPCRVQLGDVWQVGRHTVACLDSTDPQVLLRFFAGMAPALVWADPPYGISIVNNTKTVGGGAAYRIPFGGVEGKETPAARQIRLQGARDTLHAGPHPPMLGDESPDTAARAAHLFLETFPEAVHIWWGAQHYVQSFPISPAWIVWDKENGGTDFADAELAWCNRGGAVRVFRHMWNGMLKASEHGQTRIHPTQKPIALAVWAFARYLDPPSIILDPFLGSGSSLIAAEQTGHTLLGFELSPQYLELVLQRAAALGLTISKSRRS